MLAGGGMAIKPEGEYGFFACRAFFCGSYALWRKVSHMFVVNCISQPGRKAVPGDFFSGAVSLVQKKE